MSNHYDFTDSSPHKLKWISEYANLCMDAGSGWQVADYLARIAYREYGNKITAEEAYHIKEGE